MHISNERSGAVYASTLRDNVYWSMRLVREEPFGPASLVIAFDTLDEAIGISNGMPLGLSSCVLCEPAGRDHVFHRQRSARAVNVWSLPGCRIELMLFGSIRDSEPGHKEGRKQRSALPIRRRIHYRGSDGWH
ncbi:aldehyde dehydrogenase family protein [Burkholderia sp. Ax-1724]|uniref:aldehyde dehydrogenase family protein n=1 Tax=Burkholderia sp. Ax-1724 TaxID=2608336 RepID=UPI00141DD5BE|nr:aldehyde dehydrogenase family protein [Burkholderia sp. Ax-1724]